MNINYIIIFTISIVALNVILIMYYELRKLSRFTKILFSRTWEYEKLLLRIVDRCPSDVHDEITLFLKHIKRLE